MSSLLQQLNSEISAIVEQARKSLVQISNGRGGGVGSGTIWHGDGLIMTKSRLQRYDRY